jgi:hypothetical protein
MSGTAYRTNIRPERTANIDSIYAVYPPARYGRAEETTHVYVSSSPMVGDTVVHPCDRDGNVLSLQLLGCVPVLNHRKALEAAGYELEVFAYVRA